MRPNQRRLDRSARNIHAYKQIFGLDFKQASSILDLGAGDATAARDIGFNNPSARVMRLDVDYARIRPAQQNTPTVAADASRLPFRAMSFDLIVSYAMFYYLGRRLGTEAVKEVLRVLEDDGQAFLYPGVPYRRSSSQIARRQNRPSGLFATPVVVITKPAHFDSWDEEQKQLTYSELVKSVTFGRLITGFINLKPVKVIQRARFKSDFEA